MPIKASVSAELHLDASCDHMSLHAMNGSWSMMHEGRSQFQPLLVNLVEDRQKHSRIHRDSTQTLPQRELQQEVPESYPQPSELTKGKSVPHIHRSAPKVSTSLRIAGLASG